MQLQEPRERMGGEPTRAMGMLTGAEVTGIDQQFQMLRMEVLTRVAGGVAHDLNNVLCSVIANASFIRMEKNLSSECDELLQEIERSGLAAANLARQLLKLSRAETTAEAPVRLPVLIRECVEVALKGTGIRPAFELDEDCAPILAQEGRLRQAVVYLIIRLRQAMAASGACVVSIRQITLRAGELIALLPGNYARIVVRDQQRALTSDLLTGVLESAATMKTIGNGAYLSASRDIIKAHGGHLFLDAAPGRGPALSLYLPVYAGEMDELPTRYSDVIHGSGRILFMDDEFTLRDTFGRAAYGLGYEAELAADGAQAVEMFAAALASGAKFNAVVLDLTVPGGLGAIETLPLLRDLDPAIKVVASTGYSDGEVDANIAEIGFDALLPKPHSLSELSRILAFATSL